MERGEAGAVVSVSDAVIPGQFGPLPALDPAGDRVLLGLNVPAATGNPDDATTALQVLDLESDAIRPLGSVEGTIAAAVWSCDGSSFLALADGRVVTENGDTLLDRLPRDTFLVGVGGC